MDIVLVNPEIPHNSGCAARLSAGLQVPLHFVKPLGFSLEDKYLKRAGLDYWAMVDLHVHEDWQSCLDHLEQKSQRPVAERLHLLSARGGSSLFETQFAIDSVLVFGSETKGLPKEILDEHLSRRVYVPIDKRIRSLNLANVVCLTAYTAMVSAQMPLPNNNGSYERDPQADYGVKPSDLV
ncbi:MAG: tRNA (cytidine(34)-2'-O)-methyltransferase [Planctomycetota bacterium]|jgi:tRNA (cytidine/uridine-2'-O-)-methyltransferase|nr:tRNA (cytidine(34)-2'-O)-methyltransferase [Planctomycetota bacterium]